MNIIIGNILTVCSSKKQSDKVDEFINISVHGKVKVDETDVAVKVDEEVEVKVDETDVTTVEPIVEKNNV